MVFLEIYDDGQLFWITREYYWDSMVQLKWISALVLFVITKAMVRKETCPVVELGQQA